MLKMDNGKDLYDVVNNKRLKEKLDYNLTLIIKLSMRETQLEMKVESNAKGIERNRSDKLIFKQQLANNLNFIINKLSNNIFFYENDYRAGKISFKEYIYIDLINGE